MILEGDALTRLRELPDQSVQCCVTSPPFYGLRDYDTGEWVGGDPECDHRLGRAGAGRADGMVDERGQRNRDGIAGLVGSRHQAQGATSIRAGRKNVEAQRNDYLIGRASRPDNGLTGGKATVDAGTLTGPTCRCGAQKVEPTAWGGDRECAHAWGPTGSCVYCDAWRGQLGLEPTPEMYVEHLVEVFAEVRRVLRDDGVLWLNLGDSYNAAGRSGHGTRQGYKQGTNRASATGADGSRANAPALKPKDLIGIPWLAAFALRDDGWWLRDAIVWNKPNPMPESVTDRCTQSYEMVFMLTKNASYFYDQDAIREDGTGRTTSGNTQRIVDDVRLGTRVNDHLGSSVPWDSETGGRNKRNVWSIATRPYADAHFATFPPKLVEPMALAGSSPKACGECGAPWRRATDVQRDARDFQREMQHGASGKTGRVRGGSDDSDTTWSHRTLNGSVPSYRSPLVETTGWAPTCGHVGSVGSTVLDPFAGSGTVGVVCEWHGRSFIGIELSPAYAEMARQRIEVEGRLRRSPYRPEAQPEAQEALFEASALTGITTEPDQGESDGSASEDGL